MNIISECESRISVELTLEDMRRLRITYDSMDYAGAETRRALWTVLDEVRKLSGAVPDFHGGMIIETLPEPEGGCIMIFSARGGCAGYTCRFKDIDALIDCVRALSARRGELSLFESGGVYYAVFADPALRAVFCEYGDVSEDREGYVCAHMCEYMNSLNNVY